MGGTAAVCVDGGCVALQTPDCPRLEGAYTDDNAVLFGVMNSNRGANAQLGQEVDDGLALAVNEINDNGGIPSSDPCKPAKKLAFVACDDTLLAADGGTLSPDAGAAARNARVDHLAADLDVPVIAGGITSGDTLSIVQYMIPTYGKMFFSDRASAPVFATSGIGFNASPNGQRLFWRTEQNTVIEGAAMALMYGDIETALKASNGGTPLKVYIIEKNDAFGTGTVTVISGALMVNGAPVLGNANVKTGEFQPTAGVGAGTTVAAVLADIESFNPDVIINVGTDELVNDFFAPYEAYVGTTSGQKKPTWLASHASISPALVTWLSTLSPSELADLHTRWRGANIDVVTALSTATYTDLKTTYPADSPAQGVLEGYDIAYVLGYAATAAYRAGPVTTSSIITGVNSILTGAALDVGPANYLTAAQQVAAGGTINLNGASGPLDFNVTTGESPSDDEVWCISIDPNTQMPYINQNAGQVYDHTTMMLTGTFNCQ
jgi:branched-chain amino acid transport system substrate-binding protein